MTLTLIGYALYDSINYLSLSWPALCFFLSFLHADSNKIINRLIIEDVLNFNWLRTVQLDQLFIAFMARLCFFLSFLHADSNKKTLGCKQLKILMKLNYTKQVSFYCFHFKLLKKVKTEKRLTLLTLCHAFLPLKNGRANIDTNGVYCLIPALRFDTT